jgi:hypothetical protein
VNEEVGREGFVLNFLKMSSPGLLVTNVNFQTRGQKNFNTLNPVAT